MAVRETISATRFQIGSSGSDSNWVDGSRLSQYRFYNNNYLWLEFDFCEDGSTLNIEPISLSFSAAIDPGNRTPTGNVSCAFYTGNPFSGGTIYKTETSAVTSGKQTVNSFDATRTARLSRYLYVRVSFTSSTDAFKSISARASSNVIVDAPSVTLTSPLNTTKDGDSTIRFSWSVSNTGTNTKTSTLHWKGASESDWHSESLGANDYKDFLTGTLPNGTVQWYVTSSNGYATGTSSTGSFTVSYSKPALTITSPSNTSYAGSGQIVFAWTLAKGADSIERTEAQYSINGKSYVTFVDQSSLVTGYTATNYYFSESGTVQWRVRCKHKIAGWGNYATGQFTVTYTAPSVTLTAPISEQKYGDQSIAFSWSITQGNGSVQQTQLQYSANNGTSWTSLLDVDGSRTSYTASAKSIPTGNTLWRVRVRGQYTGWTTWKSASFTVLQSLPSTTAVSPSAIYKKRTSEITFTWQASITYGTITGAKLEYDTGDGQGWRTLGSVSGTATTYTAPANTFPAVSSISWRVCSKNGDNQYGGWSTQTFATVDAATSAAPMRPGANSKQDETQAILFEWSTTNSLGSAPTGADLQWQLAGGEWQTLGHVDGASKQFTAPANTFPGALIYWRVRAYNQDGVVGNWSNYSYFSTIDTPSVATALSPSGTVEDADSAITFQWSISNQSGTPSTGSDLDYSRDGLSWTRFASLSGQRTSYVAPGDTFPPGAVTWRVRSYNRNHTAGDWSAPLSFVARAAPTVNEIKATAKPFSTISWQSDDQLSYECFVDGKSCGSFFGTEREYQLPDRLEDGNHTVGVRVMGSFSLWSHIKTTDIHISNVPGSVLVLKARTNIDADLTWTGGSGNFYVYRDGLLIGRTHQHSFADRTAVGTHDYQVIERLANGNYNLSAVLTRTPSVDCQHIAALSGGDWIAIPHTLKGQSDPTYSESQNVAHNHVGGMDLPTASIGTYRDDSGTYSAVFLYTEKQEHERFRALRGKPVILKTADGEVVIGVLHAWERSPKLDRHRTEQVRYTAYTFTIQRIGWEDFIDDTQ